jgi:hypothetical protein
MQNMEQNQEIRALTDAELEAISGAGIFSRIVHFVHDLFAGPGDHRRSLDRP